MWCFLIIFPFMIFSAVLTGEELNTSALEPNNDIQQTFLISYVPAGTSMVIPDFILDEYQEVADQWDSNPSYYLVYHYGTAKPSLMKEGKDAFYIPLNQVGTEEIMMMEIRNLSHNKEENLFITRERVPTLIIPKEIIARENFSELITITRK